MIRLNVAPVMVLDQDEALDLYVNRLGLEVAQDVKQGSLPPADGALPPAKVAHDASA